MKETNENLKQMLNKPEYSRYGQHICGDLKCSVSADGSPTGIYEVLLFFM
jgi:hypothetical protein